MLLFFANGAPKSTSALANEGTEAEWIGLGRLIADLPPGEGWGEGVFFSRNAASPALAPGPSAGLSGLSRRGRNTDAVRHHGEVTTCLELSSASISFTFRPTKSTFGRSKV